MRLGCVMLRKNWLVGWESGKGNFLLILFFWPFLYPIPLERSGCAWFNGLLRKKKWRGGVG